MNKLIKRKKRKLDEIVSEKLDITKSKAQAIILSGKVHTENKRLDKPGLKIFIDTNILIKEEKQYVGRGAYKLLHAIDTFNIYMEDKVVCDIGASTGGFTEISLLKGASIVYAVDVGTNQLDYNLRQNTKVISMEQTDIRDINSFKKTPDIFVIDVSFISLHKILPHCIRLSENKKTEVIALFKPQFESDKETISRYNGVIKDESISKRVLDSFLNSPTIEKFKFIGHCKSPIKGNKGNTEYLLHLGLK